MIFNGKFTYKSRTLTFIQICKTNYVFRKQTKICHGEYWPLKERFPKRDSQGIFPRVFSTRRVQDRFPREIHKISFQELFQERFARDVSSRDAHGRFLREISRSFPREISKRVFQERSPRGMS